MAFTYELKNTDKSLIAQVCPAHGGMVTQLYLQGQPVFHLDAGSLETAPMAAGGMPLLFPFPSKTREDTYTLEGKTYRMPMHGLVKNAPFAVSQVSEDSVTVWMEPSPAWISDCYPFDFRLEVTYRLTEDALLADVLVTNRSDRPMPHYLGWHPFFLSTDKSRITLDHDFSVHYDYGNCVDYPAQLPLDLSTWLDDVFHTPANPCFTLTNTADGYEVNCTFSEDFEALVVCSWVKESMCVEPWCGIPDSINQNRFLRTVAPGETAGYQMKLQLKRL